MPTSTSNATANASSDLRDEFNSFKTEVSQFIETLKAQEEERMRRVRDNVSDTVARAGVVAKETLRSARQTGEEALGEMETQIRDNPLKSLAIAFAVGYLASRLGRSDH